MTPGLDVKAVTDEIRLRIDEELDYELEAQNQRSLARVFRGHPFIHVPDVVTRMSRERVIVSEFVEGTRFATGQLLVPGDVDGNRHRNSLLHARCVECFLHALPQKSELKNRPTNKPRYAIAR